MIDQTTQTTLDRLAGPLNAPTAVRLDERVAVVLAATDAGEIAVWTDGGVHCYPATTVVGAINDAVREETALREALRSLYQLEREAADQRLIQADEHTDMLDRIRSYAVRVHQEGDIGEDGLNTFLRHFNLDEYEPCVQLDYRMTGRFTVASHDLAVLQSVVPAVVAPNFEAVAEVNVESAEHRTTVVTIEPKEAADGQPHLVVAFEISGSYDVGYHDVCDAETDGLANLCPSFDGITGLLPATMTYEIETLYGERLD